MIHPVNYFEPHSSQSAGVHTFFGVFSDSEFGGDAFIQTGVRWSNIVDVDQLQQGCCY